MDNRLKKNVQIITVVAVVLVVVLALIAVTLLVQQSQLKSMKSRLQAELDALDRTASSLEEEQAYRNSLEYVEKYAREQLGLVKAGEKIWRPSAGKTENA